MLRLGDGADSFAWPGYGEGGMWNYAAKRQERKCRTKELASIGRSY